VQFYDARVRRPERAGVGRGLVFVDARFSRRVIFQSCHARHMRGSALSRLSTMRFPYFFRVRHGNSSSRELSSFRNSICAHIIREGGGARCLPVLIIVIIMDTLPLGGRRRPSLRTRHCALASSCSSRGGAVQPRE